VFQLCKAELVSIGESVNSLRLLEERVSHHTVNKSVLHGQDIIDLFTSLSTSLNSKVDTLEDDVQTWNRFDDLSTEMMEQLLTVEHDVSTLSLPDNAEGKHHVANQLQVCFLITTLMSR